MERIAIMASRARFPVYRGEKPYVFISYAHVDSEFVLPIAEELHKRRYRVWYDEGIEAGTRWAEFIASGLEGASVVVFFPSVHFNNNRNCEREVNFAVDAKKNMACIQLDEADMPAGLKMQLSTAQTIPAGASATETAERLIHSGALSEDLIGDGKEGYETKKGLENTRVNVAMIIGFIGIVLALCFGLALLGFTRGWFGEKSGLTYDTFSVPAEEAGNAAEHVEVTAWSSQMMRDLFISQTTGEAMYCCGNTFVTARNGIDYRDGAFLVGGEAVTRGDISDLSVVSKLTNLVELALCYENITDISALTALVNLTYLDLSGNDITDISPLTGLNRLTTLKISHTSVTDLSPVLAMPGLKRLYLSFDMVDFAEGILAGNFDVIITE
jgi:hypothetical protein